MMQPLWNRVGKFRAMAVENWQLKLGALVAAVVLWYIVTGQSRMQRILDATLFFQDLPENMALIDPPKTVQVNVEGPTQIVRSLQPSDLAVHINLSGIEPGARIIPLSPDMVTSAVPGVQILSVEPSQLNLIIDRIVQMQVHIQPQLVGQLAEGFQITSVRIMPPIVTVEGPSRYADRVKYAVTETINIHMQHSSFSRVVAVGVPVEKWTVVEPRNVTVYVQIQEIPKEVTVTVPVDTGELPDGWGVRPSQVKVTLVVPYTKTGEVRAELITVKPVLGEERPRRGLQVPLQVSWPDTWRGMVQRHRVEPDRVMLIRQRRSRRR